MALLAGSSLVGMAGEGKPRGMHPNTRMAGCFGSEQLGTMWGVSAQTSALNPYASYDDKIQGQLVL